MRWSIVRLIWLRELRDQLRDRRTVFMIAVLPILLYPLAGFGVMQLVAGSLNQNSRVGILGIENLPPTPALLAREDGRLRFAERYLEPGGKARSMTVVPLEGPVPRFEGPRAFFDRIDRSALSGRQVDVLLVVPPDFSDKLAAEQQPVLFVLPRPKDDSSRLVEQRVQGILERWKQDLKSARLLRHRLPEQFDKPFVVYDPEREKSLAKRQEEGMLALLVRIFPFVLVMWSLAGALYPAVDLCAGEKERGTMETLLISPAGREEIVWGKFLTIWVFSAATALLNLLSMVLTTAQFASVVPGIAFHPLALFWGVALLLPLSAFFSAVCLAIGAYARSSKEGQYYLMPLFLVTLPLIFLTLAPGVELNPFYSMVPVTGVALLLQKLMAAEPAETGLYLYFVPVLAPMIIYSWLALRWAIAQFQREEVLFREAERLDLGLWLKRLLRDKEALPSGGEAFFCFGLILALRWLAFNVGTHLPLLARTGVSQLAFVATPPLFMAVILTTRPRLGLGLRRPPVWALLAGAFLAVVVLPPFAELTLFILRQFPGLKELLEEYHPLTGELRSLSSQGPAPGGVRLRYFLVLALLPALCEEVAFRGFILSGLRRGFRTWAAILLSSFLFALYQMNVFQFVPHFLAGIVLALLVVRSGSVLPAMTFHLVFNSLLIGPSILLPEVFGASSEGEPVAPLLRVLLSLVCAVLAVAALLGVRRLGREAIETKGDIAEKADR